MLKDGFLEEEGGVKRKETKDTAQLTQKLTLNQEYV